MSDSIHLWPESPREENGHIRLSARLELGPAREETLWYDVPEEYRSALSDDADPFVVATALRMAQEGRPVRVHGTVSPSLLLNLEEYLSAWSAWRPKRYSSIEITADDERDRQAPKGPIQAICGFSGGVDSSFTAYRHVKGVTTRFPQPLTAGIMVQGFDIPLEEDEMFARAVDKARRQLGSLGLEAIQIATNFRSLNLEWTQTFGAAVASVMMLFGKRFSRGLIAQGVPFKSYRVLVEGSNPLTDPLLSSSGFRVIPDGAGFGRPDKIRVIADWPEAMQELRVCWRGEQKDRNCCECEKCIRNILTFRALGLGLPTCFESDVTDEQIHALGPLKEIIVSVGYTPIAHMAEAHGMGDQSWVRALRSVIRRNRRSALVGRLPGVRRVPPLKRFLKRAVSLRWPL